MSIVVDGALAPDSDALYRTGQGGPTHRDYHILLTSSLSSTKTGRDFAKGVIMLYLLAFGAITAAAVKVIGPLFRGVVRLGGYLLLAAVAFYLIASVF